MEDYLRRNFAVESKRTSEEALMRWRSAVRVVKNPRRRFRMVADLAKRAEAERKRVKLQDWKSVSSLNYFGLNIFGQEKLRIALYVQKAALHFIEGMILNSLMTTGSREVEFKLSHNVQRAGFRIEPDELGNIVRSHGKKTLESHGGIGGLAKEVSVSLNDGVVSKKVMHNEIKVWSSSDALKLLDYFAIAVTIIVVAVPEGLPLAVTLSLAFAMKKLMSDKALVRHLSACETMGSASCICTDKTGTLTTNHMVVDKIWVCNETKTIKSNDNKDILKSAIPEAGFNTLLQSIFQNTGSEVVKGKDGKTNILGTPTETALLEFGLLLGGDFKVDRQESAIVKVEPFNSVKKKMSVLVSLPNKGGFRAFCKGASEIILEMCDKIVNAKGEAVTLSKEQRKITTDVINSFACEALRTLCLAYRDIDSKSNADSIPDDKYTLIAVVGIKDPVRLGVKEAVQTCLAAGITVRMVTGDNINTAKAIAKECGILTDDGLAIEGTDFRSKSPQEMKELIPKLQVMARSSPTDKHTLVTQLRNVYREVVAVTGDGTNDAPALHEADIGLAMGIAGTEFCGKRILKLSGENATAILNTFIFNTFVFCQVFNEINSRDIEKINVFRGIFDSWVFMGVMVSTVVFQIVIVEFLGTFAGTVPLSWDLWLGSVLIGAVGLLVAVFLKCLPVETGQEAVTAEHHDGYEPLPTGPDRA
ncbi:hypothetical protein EZV62_017189 [Acer yangbiense]|uniref:P-type Cu(+) transporter n=1 Tax=Acer yangbiense TaxID=1000413 RepID=A0A5C7HI26_9ROSI|nr:hypothetical protein EZV62_017189 [Acer yangbiense]